MKKLYLIIFFIMCSFNTYASSIDTKSLNLTDEQTKKISELKEQLKAEIDPIWEEIESAKNHIKETEKRYFEEFWNILTDEQKEEFAKLNQ